MWRQFRRSIQSGPAVVEEDHRRALLLAAVRALAGVPRGVVYDLPLAHRPHPIHGSIFVRGDEHWRRYLDAREEVDHGEPTVLVSLRVLDDEERHLVVDWGTTYANTFLLIEPADWRCDLTDPANPFTRALDEAIAASAGTAEAGRGPVLDYLRGVFGTWRCWTASNVTTRGVALHLNGEAGDAGTIWGALREELAERFPQAAFDRSLARLYASDRELFVGPVSRARSVFRTRLGLPVLYEAERVDRAVRRMVNQGAMRVVAPSLPGQPTFGWGRPVPNGVSEEEFARFVMV